MAETGRHQETQRDTEKQRDKETPRETERATERQTDSESDKETETMRDEGMALLIAIKKQRDNTRQRDDAVLWRTN